MRSLWRLFSGHCTGKQTGNDGNTNKSYPASYDAVMSVAAVDEDKNIADFSQQNDQVDIAAPGVKILSTVPGNEYRKLSGTSMASPHVAGVAALIWSYFPGMSLSYSVWWTSITHYSDITIHIIQCEPLLQTKAH